MILKSVLGETFPLSEEKKNPPFNQFFIIGRMASDGTAFPSEKFRRMLVC